MRNIKDSEFIVGFIAVSQLLMQPIAGQAMGGANGNGMAGGRLAVPAQTTNTIGRVREPGLARDFEHSIRDRHFANRGFGLGYGYGGFYPYDYSYPLGETEAVSSSGIEDEEIAEEQRYDKAVHTQDNKRLQLPTSAFVKNYRWPTNSQPQSVATSKPVRKAM